MPRPASPTKSGVAHGYQVDDVQQPNPGPLVVSGCIIGTVGQLFYALPEFMDTHWHEARMISHLVAQPQMQVNDSVDNTIPLPVVDQQRVRDVQVKTFSASDSGTHYSREGGLKLWCSGEKK